MSASIESLRNGGSSVIGASRNDLQIGDVVTLFSVGGPATSYSWVLIFKPQGSTAAFSGSPTAPSPGSFTVDLEGPYLIRLTVDSSLPTEDTQYVRLRNLTAPLGLRLVAAGERRDTTGIIPVDASLEGWANDQNYTLQVLETAIQNVGSRIISMPFTFSSPSPVVVGPLSAGEYVMQTRVFLDTAFDDPAATIAVGTALAPNDLFAPSDIPLTETGTFVSDMTYGPSGSTNVTVTISPAASTVGSGVVFIFVHTP